MRARAVAWVAAVALAGGCALYGDPSDGDAPRACRVVDDEWRDLVDELDDSCVRDDECILVREEGGYCDCRMIGLPVNRASYDGSAAQALAAEFDRCEGELSVGCDFGDRWAVCDEGRCGVYEDYFCNPPSNVGDECSPRPAFDGWETPCQQGVCAEDPWCCTVAWDAACADRAAARCGLDCDSYVYVTGDELLGRNESYPNGSTVAPLSLPGVTAPASIAWGHGATPDASSMLAVAGPCGAHIVRTADGVESFARAYADCRFGGTRAIWVDLDHDDHLDGLFAGADAVFWAQGDPSGWTDGGDLIPWGDGAFTDVAALDVDGDLELDLVVTYAGAPASLFIEEPGPGFGFQRDLTWVSASSGLTRAMACQLDADPARELILGGPATTEVFDVVDGVLTPLLALDVGTTEIACGMVSPVPAAALAGADGVLRVLTAEGITWSSPTTFDVVGLEVVQTGYRWSLVIAETGADTPLSFVSWDAATEALVVQTGMDPLPGVDATALAAGKRY